VSAGFNTNYPKNRPQFARCNLRRLRSRPDRQWNLASHKFDQPQAL